MKYLNNFKIDQESLTFDVNNISHAFLNAIRRLIISDVPTLGFRTQYGKESDIVILKNTSSLHNEFLAHRISLVPVNYDSKKIESFEKDKLEFFIDVTNNTTKPMDVTTEHIQIRDLTRDPPVLLSKEVCRKFFPPNRITKDFILLNRLKANKGSSSEDGETLNITMKADYSPGKEHSRYCPTCVSIFTNRRDDEKIKLELEKRLKEKEIYLQAQNGKNMTSEEKEDFIQTFMLGEADRYFLTDAEGEPNAFTFTIESDGRIMSHNIFDKALFILEDRINKFMVKIQEEEKMEIQKSNTVMFSYDFIF